MSVTITLAFDNLDEEANYYKSGVDIWEDTEIVHYTYSAQGGNIKVYENPAQPMLKSKLRAIYNWRHVVKIEGNGLPSMREREMEMMGG